MSWYWITDPDGIDVRKVFVMKMEDLAANVPPGHTVRPSASQDADD